MPRIKNQYRQWGDDYDAEQILGDIEDFDTAYDIDKLPEEKFISYIVCMICDYAKSNDYQIADTVKTMGENLVALTKIANFDNWTGDNRSPATICAGYGKEEKYTLEQIIDAITQADEEVYVAIAYKDREMLEDVLKEYLEVE